MNLFFLRMMDKMMSVTRLIVILLPAIILGQDNGVTELRVEVLERPPECLIASDIGDILKVHYTGTLTNGTVFDTR